MAGCCCFCNSFIFCAAFPANARSSSKSCPSGRPAPISSEKAWRLTAAAAAVSRNPRASRRRASSIKPSSKLLCPKDADGNEPALRVSVKGAFHIREDLIGDPPGVDRQPEKKKVFPGKCICPLSFLRQSKRYLFHREMQFFHPSYPQAAGQSFLFHR